MGYKNNKILDNLDYVGKKEKSQRVEKGNLEINVGFF